MNVAAYCSCGERATVYMDLEGDPLEPPLCAECFADLVAVEGMVPSWDDEEEEDWGNEMGTE